MTTEADVSFLGHSVDLSMDGSFSDFTTQASLLDPRTHPSFDQALAGKLSPGTPSQFLLTPSSLWDRSAFDDTAMDIFADFSEAHDQPSEQQQQARPSKAVQEAPDRSSIPIPSPDPVPIKIKEESLTSSTPPHVTRRLTRATSSGSHATRNTSTRDTLPTVPNSDTTKVKKPRSTSKRTTKGKRGQMKEKQRTKEEKAEEDEHLQVPARLGEQPTGEDDVRRNKFLERNRVAASKCRQKKKEWMHSLEETKAELEKTHTSLHETLNGLLAEISVMKEHLMMHATCGDQNIDQWFVTEARKFVESKTREDDARRQSSSSQQSDRNSAVQFSPTSSIVPPTLPSPQVKEESFSYDYMPDDMFADEKV